MLLNDMHTGNTYNLVGEAITQTQLAVYINEVYKTNLKHNAVPVDEYKSERRAALGDFIGTIIAGIYEGIKNGANEVPSDQCR
jgi:NAD(P)H dehydrogenase (quinone)